MLRLSPPLTNSKQTNRTDDICKLWCCWICITHRDDPSQKFTSIRKSYAPVAYGSKTFNRTQIKMSIYAKEFLATYFAFKEIGQVFWGAPKPVNILTYNKAVTRFFQKLYLQPCGTHVIMSSNSILS